ncbi:hypothetical protein Lal_00013736 [Lupinus albus]|nr:hypothetical protein Lal_00013736 [Lupinus albus]
MYLLLEQSETPSRAAVDLDVLWVDARKNKQGVVDNEKVQEAVNRVVKEVSIFLMSHVTLKEKESFYTADSQVSLEKALGMVQYPGRIRGAGFGARKQYVTPSTKRLTKANAVVLQDKYDSLAERFHTMEKRMEADDALLPIPVDEDIITVGLALATFVAWPKHLIDNLPADSTINISLPDPNYGYSTEEYITKNDVTDVHRRDWIGASILSVYIRALNTYRALNPKRQRPANWIHVKTPHQNNNKDYDFYVINFMMEYYDIQNSYGFPKP